jgi:hypothetical protein
MHEHSWEGIEIVSRRGAAEIDPSDPELIGVRFSDRDDPTTVYHYDRFTATESAEHVEADLTIIDTEYGEKSVRRVLIARYIREALDWKVGVAAATVVSVGVMTLHVIRKKRANE